MPGPHPALQQPWDEDFEQLIGELSATYQRLRQRMAELAMENAQLQQRVCAGTALSRDLRDGQLEAVADPRDVEVLQINGPRLPLAGGSPARLKLAASLAKVPRFVGAELEPPPALGDGYGAGELDLPPQLGPDGLPDDSEAAEPAPSSRERPAGSAWAAVTTLAQLETQDVPVFEDQDAQQEGQHAQPPPAETEAALQRPTGGTVTFEDQRAEAGRSSQTSNSFRRPRVSARGQDSEDESADRRHANKSDGAIVLNGERSALAVQRRSRISDGSPEVSSKDRDNLAARVKIDHEVSVALVQASLFENLDKNRASRLSFRDLEGILEKSHESVDRACLAAVLRMLNNQEAVVRSQEAVESGVQAGRESGQPAFSLDDPESLGLDFHGFQRLMRDDPQLNELTPDQIDCMMVLRRACRIQGGRKKIRMATREFFLKSDKSDEIKRQPCLRRYGPVVLEWVPPLVIMLNAIVAGLNADHPSYDSIWEICEYVFVCCYIGEFVMKIHLFGFRDYFRGKDAYWNWFDLTCLIVSLSDCVFKIVVAIFVQGDLAADGGLFTMLRILRLSRLARLVRTLRFRIFLELKMMIMGVVSGLRVLTWAIVLLLMLIYIVGVAMTTLLEKEPEFNDMRSSMFTLFRCWTDGCSAIDGTPLFERIRKEYGFHWMVFHILMTMFITVGLFNLIMAIFIDNVLTTQATRKHIEMVERSDEIELKLKYLIASYIRSGTRKEKQVDKARSNGSVFGLRQRMISVDNIDHRIVTKEWEILREMDVVITREVFMAWLEEDDFQQLLDEAEIDFASRWELFDVLDADMGGQLSMDELTQGLMTLRGMAATKADIVAIRLKIGYLVSMIERTTASQPFLRSSLS